MEDFIKVPQIGWNNITPKNNIEEWENTLLEGIDYNELELRILNSACFKE